MVSDTPPCMYVQNVPVCTVTTRTCVSTCRRGAGTHGDVWNAHTEAFRMDPRRFQRATPNTTHTAHQTQYQTQHQTQHQSRHQTQQKRQTKCNITRNITQKRVIGIITCSRGPPKENLGPCTFSSLRTDEEQTCS